MKRKLTCICCPLGCTIEAEFDPRNKEISGIKGNGCARGAEYAESECVNPVRTVTSTVRSTDGRCVPVKTDRAIPKDKIFDCMKIINGTVISLPVKIGDIAIRDVFGSNIVVAAAVEQGVGEASNKQP